MGGVTDVYRENNNTYVEVLYEDMDRETQNFTSFIETHAFCDDIYKKHRLADLAVRHKEVSANRYGKVLRRRKSARRRTHVEGVAMVALIAAYKALTDGG